MAAFVKVRSQLELQHYLEQRAKQLHSWAARGGIASLELRTHKSRTTLDSVLVPLVTSRLCCGEEWRALSATSRAQCRNLGRFEALIPLFNLLLKGFAEMQGLSDAAASCLQRLDEWNHSVRARLEGVTKAELNALKTEVCNSMPTRPATCRCVLEIASQLLQPNEKAHDDFAVRRLAVDLRAVERALAYGPAQVDQLHPVIRQRVSKCMALHADAISVLTTRDDAAGALAAWLQVTHEALVEYPKIRGMYRAKEAVASHIVSLAKWGLRPHGCRRFFGRPVPPAAAHLPQRGTAMPLSPSSAYPHASTQPQGRQGFEIAPPATSRPAAPSRRCFGVQRPQAAVPRSQASAATGAGSGPSLMLDSSRAAPLVPTLDGRPKLFTTTAAASPPALGEAATGLGASRALETWLREFGRPCHVNRQSQVPAVQPAVEAYDELTPAVLLATAAEKKAQRGTISSCSTASTAGEEAGRYCNFASAPASSASSVVGIGGAPYSSWPATATSMAAPWAATEWQQPAQTSLLELSSDDDDVFDLSQGP